MRTVILLAILLWAWPSGADVVVDPGSVHTGPRILGEPAFAFELDALSQDEVSRPGWPVTTTRSTPVPCEVSPGVWEMVPKNTACVGRWGLESWAATTSYLSYGAELDRSPWRAVEGASIDGRILTGPAGSARLFQPVPVSTGPHTLACRMRALSGNSVRLRVYTPNGTGDSIVAKSVGPEWATVFHTWEIGGEPTEMSVHIYPNGSTLEIAGCWLTRTSTPGRACWGGEAPVTCAADRHTVSTEGWPTESGEIRLVYTPQGVGIGTAMYLAATTAGGAGQPSGFYLYRISATGALVFGLRRGDTTHGQNTQDLSWENGRSYHVRVRWSPERAEIWRDGVLLRSWVPTVVPDSHPDVAYIGINKFGGDPAQGSIRSLTVSSYEEVSP